MSQYISPCSQHLCRIPAASLSHPCPRGIALGLTRKILAGSKCPSVRPSVVLCVTTAGYMKFLASFALGQEASLDESRAFAPSHAGATLTVEYE